MIKAMREWNALIDDVVAGNWTDPETGKPAKVPFKTIMLAETLDGGAADVAAPLKLGKRLAVVSDVNTRRSDGAAGRQRTEGAGNGRGDRHARQYGMRRADDRAGAGEDPPRRCADRGRLRRAQRHMQICDLQGRPALCHFRHGRFDERLCRLDRLGHARQRIQDVAAGACAARASFSISRSRPKRRHGFPLRASATACAARRRRSTGGPRIACSARSTQRCPMLLQKEDEAPMLEAAAGLAQHDVAANGYLHRVLTLCGLGVCFTGISHHGSMGEHQVSHWIDMFAGPAHPGTTHGQQVGVASLAIAGCRPRCSPLEKAPQDQADPDRGRRIHRPLWPRDRHDVLF